MKYVTESLANALYQRRLNESKNSELEDILMSKFKDLSTKSKKRLKEESVEESEDNEEDLEESYHYNGKTYKYAQEVSDSGDARDFIKDEKLEDYVEVDDTKGAYGPKGQQYVLYNESVSEGVKKDGSKWTEEEVMGLIETNDKVLYGALKHLYECQTKDEQNTSSTREHNGVGFNAFDAEFLTSVCKQLIEKGTLSPKQKEVARKKLKKYKKQLVALANS